MTNNSNLYPKAYNPLSDKQNSDILASEGSFLINLLGFLFALMPIIVIKYLNLQFSDVLNMLIFILFFTSGILIMEFIFYRKKSSLSDIKIRRKFSIQRYLTRLLSLYAIWLAIAFFYWLFPVYKNGLYDVYMHILKNYWWILVMLAALYFALEDIISKDEKDPYWQLGRFLLTHKEDANKDNILELFRGWGVKFFYLALMLPYFNIRLSWFMNADFSFFFSNPLNFFRLTEELIFFIDLAVAATGYIMTLRIFNTHIRSSEPTFFGWFIAIVCYWPFYHELLNQYYLNYGTGIYWQQIFANSVWLYVWIFLILSCELIFSLSTIALGLRFSNLTYRGLITSGPYRFTKHPAYVFKNISWWLISMPFLAFNNNPSLAIRGTLLLFCVNLIYYARAKTEENHLSHYPEYVEYALEMNEKSIFAPLTKILPFLKYKAPK